MQCSYQNSHSISISKAHVWTSLKRAWLKGRILISPAYCSIYWYTKMNKKKCSVNYIWFWIHFFTVFLSLFSLPLYLVYNIDSRSTIRKLNYIINGHSFLICNLPELYIWMPWTFKLKTLKKLLASELFPWVYVCIFSGHNSDTHSYTRTHQ